MQYRAYGIDCFKDKSKNKAYSAEYKSQIVNRVLNRESESSLAIEIGVNPGTIYACIKNIGI